MSNRVGSHLNNKYSKEIEKDIRHFEGDPGTAIFFSGRHILHCGGYPDLNKTRMSVLISHKNILFAVINKLLKIVSSFQYFHREFKKIIYGLKIIFIAVIIY